MQLLRAIPFFYPMLAFFYIGKVRRNAKKDTVSGILFGVIYKPLFLRIELSDDLIDRSDIGKAAGVTVDNRLEA